MNRQARRPLQRAGPSCRRPTSSRPRATTAVYRDQRHHARTASTAMRCSSRWPVLRHRPPGHLRPPLRAARPAARARSTWNGTPVHAIVVHLGLIQAQPGAPGRSGCGEFIEREVPPGEARGRRRRLQRLGRAHALRDERHGPARLQRPARAAHADLSRRACRWRSSTSSTAAARAARPARCRAGRSGRACPTTCRW